MTFASAELSEDVFTNKKDLLDIKQALTKLKADMIKWMFIFWVGQIGVMITILNIFFK